MADDEFDDIFGDITPSKEEHAPTPEEDDEEEQDQTKAPSMSTEFDSMLSELDDAMQTTSSASVTDDFSDIFGDVSPTKSDNRQGSTNHLSKNKDKDKNQFRSAYEKDDFMGWLKEGDETVTSPANTRGKRSGSTMSEDFGDIFGDNSVNEIEDSQSDQNNDGEIEKERLNDIDQVDDDICEDNDEQKDMQKSEVKSDRLRVFSDDESDKSTPSGEDEEEESDDDLDFVIHTAPTVSTDDDVKQNSQLAQDMLGTDTPKFYEKSEDGQLKATEQAAIPPPKPQSKTSSFLSSMTSSSKPTPPTSQTSSSSSKFLSGFASAASSFSSSSVAKNPAPPIVTPSATTSQTTIVTQSGAPVQPELAEPDTRALEAAFALVEQHRQVLAEEREAASTAGVTPGTRAGFLAALQFRLSPNHVNVARVRMLSAKMGHVVPAEMRPKVWAHLLLGSDLWEDKAFHGWDQSAQKTESSIYQQLLKEACLESSKAEESEEMSALLAFFCYRRDAKEYAPSLLCCSYPLVKLKLGNRDIVSSCFYSFASSLTPGLMLPLNTRHHLIQEYHHAFKLLLSYHDPLLAQHLDRRLVDWHLPPGDSEEQTIDNTNLVSPKNATQTVGLVPSSALVALFSKLLPLSHLCPLWDHLLGCGLGISTDKNDGISSGEGRLLQPFLLLALLLREHAKLVTLDGDVLVESLKKCLSLVQFNHATKEDSSFMIDIDDDETGKEESSTHQIEEAQAEVTRLETEVKTLKQSHELAELNEEGGEGLSLKLDELEASKKQAASDKNFKLAGTIAKEIKALKEQSGTEEERKANTAAALSVLEEMQLQLEDATNRLNSLAPGNSGDASSPFAVFHMRRLKQCTGAQEWLVYAGLGCYLTGFASKEIDLIEDLLDPELCSDEDLISPPICMADTDRAYFRKLVQAQSTFSESESMQHHSEIDFCMHYHPQGPTTQEHSEIDLQVMQWCLEAYELFRRTPTSFILHALKDAEARHLTNFGDDNENTLGPNSLEGERVKEENDGSGSCLGRFCIEVSVGELVPQLCKAAGHGNNVRGRSASVTAAGQQAQQLQVTNLSSCSKSLLERGIDLATLSVLTKGSCSTLQYLGRENAQFQKPRFLCLDCRPGAHIARWGRFATTFSLDTPLDAISQDPDAMDRLFSMFASMRGRAHIVLMGVGADTSRASAPSSSTVKFVEKCGLKEDEVKEEMGHLAGLVLLFHKHNFPLVSVLEGGFAAAHLFLSQLSQLRAAAGVNSLPECGLHDLIDVGQPVKKSFFSTISTPSVKLPSYSMSTSTSSFSLSTSSLMSSSTPTSSTPTPPSTSRYAFTSLRPKTSVNSDEANESQRNSSLTPTNERNVDEGKTQEEGGEAPKGQEEEPKLDNEATVLAAEALELMAAAEVSPDPPRESVSSLRTSFNFSSMSGLMSSSSKDPKPANTNAGKENQDEGVPATATTSVGGAAANVTVNTDKQVDTERASAPPIPSTSSTSSTSAAAAAAATSMYSSMSNRFSFASSKPSQANQPSVPSSVAPPPAVSSEVLAELQRKELSHGHRLECGSLEKGEVSIAHMKVAGLLKGAEVVINGETFPHAAVFRCQKLKMKSEEFGSLKLSEVPRVDRAIVITKDRVLVLNYRTTTPNEIEGNVSSTPPKSDMNSDPEVVKDTAALAVNVKDENNTVPPKNKLPIDNDDVVVSNHDNKGVSSAVANNVDIETAAELISLNAIVKSNHHLTEIVKMTMLKKEPDILTLHFRAGAGYDTATLEGVRRRAYKMHGGKDEFIECLQVAMERFI